MPESKETIVEQKYEPKLFSELIKEIGQDKRLQPDLMKCEKGNNFRAVSESAIIDAINPVLFENNIYYTVTVKDSRLEVKEAMGKLVFVATVTVMLNFYDKCGYMVGTDSVGMGIDDGDKAMGKAYTYAIKYALLKLFRLRYGDDPDHAASKPIAVKGGPKISPREIQAASKAPKGKKAAKTSDVMTEKQRDYIIGLMEQNKVDSQMIIDEFNCDPVNDETVPMQTAKDIIKWFREDGFLPF